MGGLSPSAMSRIPCAEGSRANIVQTWSCILQLQQQVRKWRYLRLFLMGSLKWQRCPVSMKYTSWPLAILLRQGGPWEGRAIKFGLLKRRQGHYQGCGEFRIREKAKSSWDRTQWKQCVYDNHPLISWSTNWPAITCVRLKLCANDALLSGSMPERNAYYLCYWSSHSAHEPRVLVIARTILRNSPY